MIDVLANDRLALLLCVGLLGLIVGSFLNVLIYRLPVMMQREWQAQCRELLEQAAVTQDRFNLTTPASHCPHCGHRIRFWENIPIISYLYQRGRCTACQKTISIRYPLVELSQCVVVCCCGVAVWVYVVNVSGFVSDVGLVGDEFD
jgi:leader peptidase (prepilin peptidase) / N-methyltransferase